MKNSCAKPACVWAEHGQFCDVLAKAEVPLDDKWPLLILYLRGVKDFSFLSEVQKASMQELLLSVLRDKQFSDKDFDRVQQTIFAIITAPHADKLREIARETEELAQEVHVLFGRRAQEVSSVAADVDDSMSKGEEPASALSRLRDALKEVASKMEADVDTLAALSHKDSLTGLNNRRSFDAALKDAADAWRRKKDVVSLIMFDIDHFKQFNDTYGHLVGDQVLRTLGAQVQKFMQSLDSGQKSALAFRYGGEEFAVLLRGRTKAQATKIAELIRGTMEKTALLLRDPEGNVLEKGLKVTVSMGVSAMWDNWTSMHESNLLDSADKALYHAKRNGRNCTFCFEPSNKQGYTPVPKA